MFSGLTGAGIYTATTGIWNNVSDKLFNPAPRKENLKIAAVNGYVMGCLFAFANANNTVEAAFYGYMFGIVIGGKLSNDAKARNRQPYSLNAVQALGSIGSAAAVGLTLMYRGI